MSASRVTLEEADPAGAVLGFDPARRSWVTGAESETCPQFDRVPALDGVLTVDSATRDAVATDLGNIAFRTPSAVLRPRSASDIAAMVRFCRSHSLQVSTRGQAHTVYGQGLCDGLVVENRYLDRIHTLGPRLAEVDAGVRWMDLAKAAFEQSPRETPPVLTGYTGLSVGGTLSLGGIGGLVGGLRTGLQVDHVRELEVVTGVGAVERCSRHHKPDLFEAMLGGLGQCGIITKAAVELIPARQRARTYSLQYEDNATFFRDFHALLERPGIDHVYAELFPPDSSLTYKLYATVFYDPPTPPSDPAIVGGLSAVPTIESTSYLDYAFSIDTAVDALRETVDWDRLTKPWLDMWLPGAKIEAYLAEIVPTMTQRDIGPYGAGLIYPQRREHATRPFPRLPDPDGSPWVFVLDINTVSSTPGPDPTFVEGMRERNDRLFARAREAYGAVLYPIGSLRYTDWSWRSHYGDLWPAFRAAKRRYDPDRVLTPGPGIFDEP